MKEQFVTYEIAVKLKKLGFDEECFAIWDNQDDTFLNELLYPVGIVKNSNKGLQKDNNFTAPLWQQAIDWLKIKKKILVSELWDGWEIAKDGDDFDYYETKEQAILKALELCQEKKK